jgi:hypothetical protein
MPDQMILTATQPNEQIYLIINAQEDKNGVVIKDDGSVTHVMFLPYIERNGYELSPLLTNNFLRDLWQPNKNNQQLWNDHFLDRTKKFSEEEIKEIENLLMPVPKEKQLVPQLDIDFSQFESQDKKEDSSVIETKSRMKLPSFGKPAKAVRNVSEMFDGDLDGRVGDGTPEERPAPPRIIRNIMDHIMVRNPGDTKKALTDKRGNWNPERVQLHDAISTMFRRRGTKSEDPTVFLLGGGPASRKSSALNAGLPRMPKDGEAVNADADQIKELIPEYKAWKKTDKHAASHVHQESKHIHSVVTDGLLQDQTDVIYDTTGDGNYGDFKKRVEGLRSHGHKIVAHYMTNDIELAKELNYKRYKETGRKVPTHQLEYIHGQVSRVVPQALKDDLFDEFYLYDTNNLTKPPRLIASKKRGEPLKVHDKYGFKRFLKKGVPPKPPKSSKLPESSGKFKLPGFSGKPKAPTLPIGDFGGKKPKR